MLGSRQCCGQPCQKHPSTNTAVRLRAKTKSGLPTRGTPRLQPVIRCLLKIRIKASSVERFRRERTCAMMRDRTAEGTLSMLSDENKGSRPLPEEFCLEDWFRRYAGRLQKLVKVRVPMNRWYQASVETIQLQRQCAGSLPALLLVS